MQPDIADVSDMAIVVERLRPGKQADACCGQIPRFLRNRGIVLVLRAAVRQPGARYTQIPAEPGYTSSFVRISGVCPIF